MARGGLSFEGIGEKFATFKAGAGLKALVAAANRDAVVGLAVVVTAADTVDLGTDGETVFGIIDVYENDGYVTVQYGGFKENVPVNAVTPSVGRVVAVDGAGKAKDSIDGVGVKQSMSKKVTAKATTGGTVTVTVTAAGSTALATGKAVSATVDTTSTTTNATAIRDALAADTDVAAYFVVGGTGTEITLTRKVAASSEVELFDFALGTAVGATMGTTTIIDGIPDVKMRSPIFINVDSTIGTATIFIG